MYSSNQQNEQTHSTFNIQNKNIIFYENEIDNIYNKQRKYVNPARDLSTGKLRGLNVKQFSKK